MRSYLHPLSGRGNGAIDDLADLTACSAVARPERVIRVAGDYGVIVGRFYIAIERICFGYVREVWPALCVDGPCLRQHNYLAQLGTRHVVTRPEGAVRIAGDDLMVKGSFNERIERVTHGNICERGILRHIDIPTLRQDHYFGYLAPRSTAVGPESVVRITGNNPMAVKVAHSSIKVFAGSHVGE